MAEPIDPNKPVGPEKPETKRQRSRRLHREQMARLESEPIKVAPPLRLDGRPRILDPDQATFDGHLKTIVGCGLIKCTREETAAQLGVHIDTLREFFVRYPAALERYEDAKLVGNVSLRRNQFKLSESNAGMAIFLGTQWLGQRDPYKELEAAGRADAERLAAQHAIDKENASSRAGAIDVKSLDTKQLVLLLERIRLSRAAIADRARDVTPGSAGNPTPAG
jgi:hypothetical protein